MKKYILSLSIFTLTAAVVPATAMAAIDIVELASAEPSIQYNSDRTLHIENAQGEVLRIYDVTGIAVMTIKVTSSSQRIDLSNLKGCYIVKVGKLVRKISIK